MVVATKPDKSATGDSWCTPKWLCDLLGKFDLDPCWNYSAHTNARCFYTLEHPGMAMDDSVFACDGLKQDWRGSVYCNPPYSDVGPWAAKLAAHDGPWCALVKLDPSTKWWSVLMSANPTVAPFRKRLKFEGAKAMTANFPSVLVYKRWAPSDELAAHLWLQRWG